MKHHHDADANISVDIPTQDLENLVDKVTDSAIKIIVVFTVAQIIKSYATRNG